MLGNSTQKILSEPILSGIEDIRKLMARLSMINISDFELEEMFSEGTDYMRRLSMKSDHEKQVMMKYLILKYTIKPNYKITFR